MRPFILLSLLAALAFAAGCSNANTPGGESHIDASGNSVSGWVVVPTGGSHSTVATQEYLSGSGSFSCTQCHGADLSGGISAASCYGNPQGCHHGPVAGWVATPPAAQNHGVSAKKAPGSSGFASCQICHGNGFSGGGSQVSCFTCHGVSAPHAPKPWRGSPYTHATTDTANAPVCYTCHAYTGTANPNNPHVPETPAPAGTAPGCYNGTMCHNQGGHPAGWAAPAPAAQPHGVSAKKDGTVAGQGFPSCTACHGNDFAGGATGPTCLNNAACHGAGVASPHAPKPWRGLSGSPYTHTDTVEAGNAPVCYTCHAYTGTPNPNNPHVPPTPAAPGTAPGCYNGTMCHNAAGHPAGWVVAPPAAQPHGDTAKKDGTVAGQGFPSCKTCHGDNFAGGSANVSCFLCHSPPHAPKPWRASAGSTYTHTTTVEAGNAPVCYTCHAYTGTPNPLNPHVPPTPAAPGTAPGCYNGTMCHNEAGHPAGWDQATQHGSAAKSAPSPSGGFSFCQDCHGTGTTPPANFGGGTSGTSCYTCHGVSAPHPPGATWKTDSTPTHRNTTPGNAAVCAQCHQSGAGAPSCFNNTLCH